MRIRLDRPPAGALVAVPALCAMIMYARFFDGYWLGDDFANLHRAWLVDESGALWRRAWTQFFSALPSEGAFYRPVMIASLWANERLAGNAFAGWFAVNFVIHVANAVLVGMLVVRLAEACGRDGRNAGAAAAAFFGLSPALAEGVFWISARADASVTLLTLAGLHAWATARTSAVQALAMPLLLVPALGFKESAAVLPFQMALVLIGWPTRPTRAQVAAVGGCFALVALFLAIRVGLFGNAWHVYRSGDTTPLLERFELALASIGPWWHGLTRATPGAALAYVALGATAIVCGGASMTGPRARLVLALAGASAGLVVATLLNLGSMSGTGEGGRLTYSPLAWLALALGVGSAAARQPVSGREHRHALRALTVALVASASAVGAWVLEGELEHALNAERDMRALVRALPGWAGSHPGLTLLVIDEQDGPVVTARNAQGGIVMPPVQTQPLLHRVLPTLPSEIALRHDQLSTGLATRLDAVRPARVDAETLAQLLTPAVPRWPDAYACWSSDNGQVIALPAPDPADRARWVAELRGASAPCRTGR